MPVDLSASLYTQYQRAVRRAEEAEHRGMVTEAAAAYQYAAELMRKYAGYTHDKTVRSKRLARARELEKVVKHISLTKQRIAVDGDTRNSIRQDAAAGGNEDDYEAEVLSFIQKSSVKWADIGGLEDTKKTIKSAYGMALARKPQGVEISSWRNILLFGPPGTGKTLLAAATAGSLDATFFNVKVSNVLSKYFGESTRLLTALYTVARKKSPAVIFLDEFEALSPPRGSGESGAERRIVSTLLAELDGLSGKDDTSFVLTMGATNLPWTLDAAVLSRFQRRIYVPLPDDEARKAILDIHLERRGHKSLVPMEDLVQRTAGFSGREIEQLCQAAISCMTQRSNPGLLAAVDEGQEALRDYEICVEPLQEDDFATAFEEVQPMTSSELLESYDAWFRQGEGEG